VDGSGLRRLTRFQASQGIPAGGVRDVAWSSRDRLAVSLSAGERTLVYTMKPDGSRMRLTARLRGGVAIDWSPDGRRLLTGANGELSIVEVRSGRMHRLPGRGFGAVWSPDGRSIAYLPPVTTDAVVTARADGRRARTRSLVESESGYRPGFDYREYGALAWRPRR
jgi:Tol biopolymer transport system component